MSMPEPDAGMTLDSGPGEVIPTAFRTTSMVLTDPHLYARAPRNYTTKRVLRLLRIAHVRWLRPSYTSAEEMIALARQVVAQPAPILNLLFHSSEVIVGGSPYNKTEAELAAFYERLGKALTFMTGDLGAEPMTFAEFQRRFV